MKNVERALHTVAQLQSMIPRMEKRAGLSEWSVGMHIHHCLKASTGIPRFLLDSTPGEKTPRFNMIRTIVLFTGKIPRGKGKAPKPSTPDEGVTETELHELVETATDTLRIACRECAADGWWYHPVFGVLTRDQALKFVGIHNAHHLAIIRDIVAA